MAPRRTCGPPGARSAPDRPDPARPRGGGGGAAPLPAAPALFSNPTSSARRARARSHALPAAGVRSTPVPKTLSPAGRLDHSTPPPAAGSNPPADPPGPQIGEGDQVVKSHSTPSSRGQTWGKHVHSSGGTTGASGNPAASDKPTRTDTEDSGSLTAIGTTAYKEGQEGLDQSRVIAC